MFGGFLSRWGGPVERGYGPGYCCGWGPGGPLGFRRSFASRSERIAELETYLKDLEAEAMDVREQLRELRGGQPPSPGTPA